MKSRPRPRTRRSAPRHVVPDLTPAPQELSRYLEKVRKQLRLTVAEVVAVGPALGRARAPSELPHLVLGALNELYALEGLARVEQEVSGHRAFADIRAFWLVTPDTTSPSFVYDRTTDTYARTSLNDWLEERIERYEREHRDDLDD